MLSHRLSSDQEFAFRRIVDWLAGAELEFVLAGPAGTGKTFLLRALLEYLTQSGIPFHLTGTTNKASRVAAALAGQPARTIHSVLGLRPVLDDKAGRTRLERKTPARVAQGSLVVVDEASMVDKELLGEIRTSARAVGAKVLFVGDAYQLPPVFSMEAPVFGLVRHQARLTKVHRQAADNPIIATATEFREILDGHPFPQLKSNFSCGKGVCLVPEMEEFGNIADELFVSDEYRANPDHVRLLAWTNNRVRAFNKAVRRELLGTADPTPVIGERLVVNEAIENRGRIVFGTDDLVTVARVRPDYLLNVPGWWLALDGDDRSGEVFHPSDWSLVKEALSQLHRRATALQRQVREDPEVDGERRRAWHEYFQTKNLFADLRPPHASTVHKSQGSTYKFVLLDLGDIGRNTRWTDIARLCYVAFTRASEAIFVVGELPPRVYEVNVQEAVCF